VRRVAVVDADETFTRVVRTCLESEGFDVNVFPDRASARSALATMTFDLVLLDRDLPDGDGLDIVRAAGDTTPAIIVTRRGGEEDRIAGFAAGADDYVRKPVNVRELSARARAVLRRARSTNGAAYHSRSLEILLDAMIVIRDGVTTPLSLGEAEVLAVLIRHAPAAVPVTRIAGELRAPGREVARTTVEARVKSLRRKLGDAIESRPGLGYAFRGSE
jgi:DNA-binding response OmpR family regulator